MKIAQGNWGMNQDLPRYWDQFMVISSYYLGDIDFIPWNSYLRFIP